MSLTRLHRLSLALAGMLLLAPPVAAQNTGVPLLEITRVDLWGGRLLINGRARGPDRWIRIKGTSFETTSRADKTFSFDLDFRTPDCRITLISAAGEQDLMISNCGPQGLYERGNWSNAVKYKTNDLVFRNGATWRAVRNNVGVQPGTSGADWTALARKGEKGPIGILGEIGPPGMVTKSSWVDPSGGDDYEKNDLVLHNGSTWIALVDNPTTEPGTMGSEAEWALLAGMGVPGVNPRGLWMAETLYAPNDVVHHEGTAWRAIVPNDSEPYWGNPDWIIFASKGEQASSELPYSYKADCDQDANLTADDQWQTVCEVDLGPAGLYLLNFEVEAVGAPPTAGGNCPSLLTTSMKTEGYGTGTLYDLMPASSTDEEPRFLFGGVRCPDTQHTGIALHSFTYNGGHVAIQMKGTAISPSDATFIAVVRNVTAERIGEGIPNPGPAPFCGDGVITYPEACDDGNNDSGDGCTATCESEP